MQPKDSVIAAGRTLGIVVMSSDREYTVRPAPGTELTVDLAASSATLPILGGQARFEAVAGTAAEHVSALSSLIRGETLNRVVQRELQAKADAAAAAIGDQAAACAAIQSFLVQAVGESTQYKPKLSYDAATGLLDANRTLVALGCQAANSAKPEVEASLIGLARSIQALDVHKSVPNDLGPRVHDAVVEVVGGDACATLAGLQERIAFYVDRPNGLTAEQAAPLSATVTVVRARLLCA
jgi:hypothetical protein